MSGTQGKSLRLEGIKIKLDNSIYSGRIDYQVHIQNIGWQVANGKNYVSDGALAGTTGQSKRLEAIKISLTDELSSIMISTIVSTLKMLAGCLGRKMGHQRGAKDFPPD